MNQTQYSYGNGKPDSQKSPERLQHEVDEARERLGARLDTLSHRLSPGELLDQAIDMAKEHGGEFGHNLGSQVKQNPLPLILTGIGLSWLMAGTRSPQPHGQSYSAGSHTSVGDKAAGAMDKARGAMGSAAERARDMKERAGGMSHSLQERAGSAAESARWRAQQFEEFCREQPVLAGSIGIAIGAALGAMLPHTRTEDEMLGSVSEEAKSRAMAAGSEQYEKVRDKTVEAAESAREKMGGSSGRSPGSPSQPGMSASSAGDSSSGSPEYQARGAGSSSSEQRKDTEGGSHPSSF